MSGSIRVTSVAADGRADVGYPDAVDPDQVGEYPARAGAGGGYVWDAVLEYRVWCHPRNGEDDFYHAFPTYQGALDYSVQLRETDDTLAKVEEPLALIEQDEYLEEDAGGAFTHVKKRRVTEWPPVFLKRPRRTPNTIPDFLSPDAPPNRLDIIRGLATEPGEPSGRTP